MSSSITTASDSDAPSNVWASLNADLRECVIRLLAQLAFNLLLAHINTSTNKNKKETSSDNSKEQFKDQN